MQQNLISCSLTSAQQVNESTGYSPPCSHSGPKRMEVLRPLTCASQEALRVVSFQPAGRGKQHMGVLSVRSMRVVESTSSGSQPSR